MIPVGKTVDGADDLQRRFANGFQLNASYTFAKAIGLCCDDLSDSPPPIQIPQYTRLARALLPSDRTHVLSSTLVAQLPFGRDRRWLRSGLASKLAGGWQANALVSAYSGCLTDGLDYPSERARNADDNLVRPGVETRGAVPPPLSTRWHCAGDDRHIRPPV